MLAFDTQATCNGNLIRRATKGWRLSDGSLFAGAGNLDSVCALRDWCESGCVGDCPNSEDDDNTAEGLYINDLGVWAVSFGNNSIMRCEDDYHAIGSGAAYALGAMGAGASSTRAVEVACGLDVYSSAPIRVIEFAGNVEKPKPKKNKKK